MVKSYEELMNSFDKKLNEMLKDMNPEELMWILNSLATSQDARQALINKAAEKLIKKTLTNDELMIIAESPVDSREKAANMILERNPSDKHLARIKFRFYIFGGRARHKFSVEEEK